MMHTKIQFTARSKSYSYLSSYDIIAHKQEKSAIIILVFAYLSSHGLLCNHCLCMASDYLVPYRVVAFANVKQSICP